VLTLPPPHGTPLWPYIAGGIAGVVTVLAGAISFARAWRRDVVTEATEKITASRNLETLAAKVADLTTKVDRLTVKMDALAVAVERVTQRVTDWENRQGR
jgi:outer membrane murein-binding lipoprotein Lpp